MTMMMWFKVAVFAMKSGRDAVPQPKPAMALGLSYKKMVQHNDKWKKKATREYQRKHGMLPVGSGRGRGKGRLESMEQDFAENEQRPQEQSEGDSNSNAETDEEETEERRDHAKYGRRKIESNAWRFESEELDPYIGASTPVTQLIKVIDEASLEPLEPDYAHLPARPFQTNKQTQSSVGRRKDLTIKESELTPLKAQIDKANAARAFKERFSSQQKGSVLTVGEDGTVRRQRRDKNEEEVDDEIGDIDTFLAELDMRKGNLVPFTRLIVDSNARAAPGEKSVVSKRIYQEPRLDLDSFVDSLI